MTVSWFHEFRLFLEKPCRDSSTKQTSQGMLCHYPLSRLLQSFQKLPQVVKQWNWQPCHKSYVTWRHCAGKKHSNATFDWCLAQTTYSMSAEVLQIKSIVSESSAQMMWNDSTVVAVKTLGSQEQWLMCSRCLFYCVIWQSVTIKV